MFRIQVSTEWILSRLEGAGACVTWWNDIVREAMLVRDLGELTYDRMRQSAWHTAIRQRAASETSLNLSRTALPCILATAGVGHLRSSSCTMNAVVTGQEHPEQ